MRKLLLSLVALAALVAAACNPAVYEALPDNTQRDIVVAKTADAWKNKSNAALLTQLAGELNALSPGERAQAVGWVQDTWRWLDAVQANQRAAAASSGDCYSALHHFSGDHNRARKIIWRESRNNPAAANSRSSARGCFQLLQSLHSHRYTAVGCSPSQWSNAVCNVKAADHLYRQAGWSPWALTNY